MSSATNENEAGLVFQNNHIVVTRIAPSKQADARAARKNDNISMHYRGTLVNAKGDTEQFDSSYDRGSPLKFNLGAGEVIKGWDEGLEGIRVGEKRRLVISPEWGYGASRVGPIPPNSVLTFDAELVSINNKPREL